MTLRCFFSFYSDNYQLLKKQFPFKSYWASDFITPLKKIHTIIKILKSQQINVKSVRY